ncbi:MAG: polyphosphate kinase 2, partial [Bacteriovoracaceae bacterium]
LIDKIKDASKKEILSPHYPYETKLIRAEYEKDKKDLQVELVKLQRFIKQEDQRLIMVFEGRDAAGKGGTIKRFTEHINPRGARVVALEKPTEIEKGQWYFQRYIHHFPSEGEIVFFDRSWYNRAGVEKVMNFCSEDEYKSFVDHVPEFEEMIITSGIKLVKFWFSVSPEEQLRRFIGRLLDPLKQWKISPMDIQSLGKWTDYTEAKESMFFYTDTPESPWIVIKSDCKKRARLNAMRYILSLYDYKDKDESVVKGIDSKILGPADSIYESDELAHREVLKVKK